uniref:Valosin containing protein n=1 Tax=Homo sapiens TaxID=9606 RepID=A0A7P0TBF1_HUMAN
MASGAEPLFSDPGAGSLTWGLIAGTLTLKIPGAAGMVQKVMTYQQPFSNRRTVPIG